MILLWLSGFILALASLIFNSIPALIIGLILTFIGVLSESLR